MKTSDFKRKLSAFTRSATTQRDNLQELLVAGFEQAEQHGNTVYLSQAMRACVGVQSLPTMAIKDYIKAHVGNCKWSKDGAGEMAFCKIKKGADNPYTVTMPQIAWYEFHATKKVQATADVDVMKRANGFIKSLTKALKEGKVKEEDTAKVDALIKAVSHAVA